MPAISVIGDISTGHDGYPPTRMVTSPVTKTKFNGLKPGVIDPACQFIAHNKGSSVHPQDIRYPVGGSSKTFIEGYAVARIADSLNDGDVIARGSDNSFVE